MAKAMRQLFRSAAANMVLRLLIVVRKDLLVTSVFRVLECSAKESQSRNKPGTVVLEY